MVEHDGCFREFRAKGRDVVQVAVEAIEAHETNGSVQLAGAFEQALANIRGHALFLKQIRVESDGAEPPTLEQSFQLILSVLLRRVNKSAANESVWMFGDGVANVAMVGAMHAWLHDECAMHIACILSKGERAGAAIEAFWRRLRVCEVAARIVALRLWRPHMQVCVEHGPGRVS